MPDNVTQRDREAAAAIVSGGLSWFDAQRIRAGEADSHKVVQAFARHRSADTARVAELEGALQRISKLEGIGGPDAELQCADIARTALGGQP